MARAKRQMEIGKTFTLEPFEQNVKVILTDCVHRSYKGLEINVGAPDLSPLVTALVCGIDKNSGLVYLLLNFDAGAGTVAHEAWHVVHHMMTRVGAELDNEVVAYHLAYLVRSITGFQIDTRKKLKLKGRK